MWPSSAHRLPARRVVPLPLPQRPRDAGLLRQALRPRPQDARPPHRRAADMVGLTGAQFPPRPRVLQGHAAAHRHRPGADQRPRLLILDEPTTGLDPIGTRQVKDLILELGRRGKTIILSSHLLADVEDCVDRMVILYGGKIRAEGTCDGTARPATDRTTIESEPLDDATVERDRRGAPLRVSAAARACRSARVRSQAAPDASGGVVPRQSVWPSSARSSDRWGFASALRC
jgi:hypothetical protein